MRLLASGRTADVFDLEDGTVLRRFREGWPADREAATMTYLAGLGYPVPEVVKVSGPDIVMRRIDGPTMVAAFATGTLDFDGGQRMLADLHARLHALPARDSATDSILHLDLHPENVLMSPDGPVVIDWSNAIEGPAGYDLAVTAIIYAEVAADPSHPYYAIGAPALASFLRYAGVPAPEMIERALALRLGNPTLSDSEKSRLPRAAALIRL
jgi:aminoglycoside phosphotransferase (APT) family kinase protein